jgi:hypothetical protein
MPDNGNIPLLTAEEFDETEARGTRLSVPERRSVGTATPGLLPRNPRFGSWLSKIRNCKLTTACGPCGK